VIFRVFFMGICACAVAPPQAQGQDDLPNPVPRPSVFSAEATGSGASLERSLRPVPRPERIPIVPTRSPPEDAGFQHWIAEFRVRARAEGIGSAVLERSLSGVRYNAGVIEKDRHQPEFATQIWDYLDTAVSETRVRNGRAVLNEHRRLLEQIEARYGVEREIVIAVWGLESAYGRYRGRIPVIEALATLAYDGRRGRFFEQQLVAALRIIQSGDVAPERMTGSWAGAMGHTQFIPTTYLAYAVDFTGDGRRDIWSDDPADSLASTAAYLARSGWTRGQPWGLEVRLPKGFDHARSGTRVRKSVAEWTRLGVRDVTGAAVPNHGPASILLPAGARGPAFMIFGNFRSIQRYNASRVYVIGVGHLADRLAGKPPFQAGWPRGEKPLSFRQKQELQRRLTRAGFDTNGADGIIGPDTMDALRAYQASVGLTPDGFPSMDVLRRLR